MDTKSLRQLSNEALIVLDRIDPLKKAKKKTEQKRSIWKGEPANVQELPAVAASEREQLSSIEVTGEVTDQVLSASLVRAKPSEIKLSSIEVSESSRQQQEKLGALQQNALSRYIPQHIQVAIWKKAQGRCEFIDPATQWFGKEKMNYFMKK